jgi:hypothetical protein
VLELQVPWWQVLGRLLQVTAVPTQEPVALQASPVVQRLPSLQEVPTGLGV